ncbi:formylglycine-generating enzyme family protein [Salmonirosea aquatica]|uniref:SUMF1/EgtB/PvdO family nonheme iron enzyme n=1 Tax=Salmonirosea aquatica TaxID=2654236 RepID=A0A7C9BRZ2_9BACT|nr:SUMF1/EgtB/PvdO family nonheme iron enzyme [Cytophagaceae bacterium SJW1-29]
MPENIESLFDLSYTELIWIEPPTTPFLFQNKLEVPPNGPFESGFYAGKYPVTQQLYEKVMKENPSHFKGKHRPVEQVSWDKANEFLETLNEKTKDHYDDDLQFHLPTEVMWEYCARNHAWETKSVASVERHNYGDFSSSHVLDEVGWYADNSHRQTQPVGLKESNLMGLHDMNGNVWEWCADLYIEIINKDYFEKTKEKYVTGKFTPAVRGGSWNGSDYNSRVLIRLRVLPDDRKYDLGFRLFRY